MRFFFFDLWPILYLIIIEFWVQKRPYLKMARIQKKKIEPKKKLFTPIWWPKNPYVSTHSMKRKCPTFFGRGIWKVPFLREGGGLHIGNWYRAFFLLESSETYADLSFITIGVIFFRRNFLSKNLFNSQKLEWKCTCWTKFLKKSEKCFCIRFKTFSIFLWDQKLNSVTFNPLRPISSLVHIFEPN